MFKVKVLRGEDTKKVLTMGKVIDTVEEVYRAKSLGDTTVFPLVFHEFDPGRADMDIKSGWVKSSGVYGLKSVSWFKDNIKKGIPALIGMIMIFDDKTGEPIGILDGSHITGMRTGAAGAIGAKFLARRDSENLLIVGTGHVALFQVAAMLKSFKNLDRVFVYAPTEYKHSETFIDSIGGKLEKDFGITHVKPVFEPVKNLEKAVGNSDIIITATPSKMPLIDSKWVKEGTHFSCIGADMKGKEEIDPNIFSSARVFTDDTRQCIEVGEIEIPVAEGILPKQNIAGEIGEVITERIKGRERVDQITVFDATGTALLDLLTGLLALKEAEKHKIGQTIDI